MHRYDRNDLHSRPSQSQTPGVNTTRRTWGNNGFHFTVGSMSFSSPGLSFNTPGNFGANASRNSYLSADSPTRSTGASVFGVAFDLLGHVISQRQQQQQQQLSAQLQEEQEQEEEARERRYQKDSRRRHAEVSGNRGHRSEYTQNFRRDSRPNGQHSRFSESYIEELNNRTSQHRRNRSPVVEIPREQWERSQRSNQRKARAADPWAGRFGTPSAEATEEESSEYSESNYDGSDDVRGSNLRDASAADNAVVIQALEQAKENHIQRIQECRRRIHLALLLPTVGPNRLKAMKDEQKFYEAALAAVRRDLKELRSGNSSRCSTFYHPGPSPSTEPPPSTRPSDPRRSSTQTAGANPFQDTFGFGHFGLGSSSFPTYFADFDQFRNFLQSPSGAFGHFDSFFGDPFFGPMPFAGMPHSSFEGYSTTKESIPPSEGPRAHFPRYTSTRQFSNPPFYATPQPQPPSTLLQSQEAKSLFQKYNERWNALASTDPNIPYPCRGLQAGALGARDSLWAPDIRSPIASWSEEVVMQANAQAFFLGVVGLAPTYTDTAGNITCGFDKARATPTQVQQLIEILKKEKTRWHSDRLGRRNGGGADGGVNEKLQSDARARAVFHAVCELMDFTQ